MDLMATAVEPIKRKLKPEEVHKALKKQPLVGLTGAAKILGIAPPNISRLRAAGRMPQGIPVEGSADVYVKSEVVALARELARERRRRENGKP
jgi:hypothetical protein